VAERGQASIELVAGACLLFLTALGCLQLLAAGYATTLADGAVEAGAAALAAGRPVAPAVRDALPDWAERRVGVDHEGGRLTVSLRPPSPVAEVERALEVSSTAWVRPPGTRGR
jgi:hypothetical protein